MKRIILTLLISVFATLSMLSQISGVFYSKLDKHDKLSLKKTAIFYYLRDKLNYREYEAWYIASFYSPYIDSTINIKVSFKKKINLTDILKDKKITEDEEKLVAEIFHLNPTKNPIAFKFVIPYLINNYPNLNKYEYKLKNTVDTKKMKIDSLLSPVHAWMNNLEFNIFASISGINTTDSIVKKYFLKKITEKSTSLQQIFTERGLKVSENSMNPENECYKIFKINNPLNKKAYLSGTDYYISFRLSNIQLKYKKDPEDDHTKWKVKSGKCNIELYNTVANENVANKTFPITELKPRPSYYGKNSYTDLFSNLIDVIYYYSQAEVLEIGTNEVGENKIFTQLYNSLNVFINPKSDLSGFDFFIVVPKVSNANTDDAIEKILEELIADYNFTINAVASASNYVRAELRNCNFDINSFKKDFKDKFNEKLNVDYEICDNTPSFFLTLKP